MPIKKAGKKALRQTKVRTARNVKIKTNLEVLAKKSKKQIEAKSAEAEKTVLKLCQEIDRAYQKGIMKKNTAARKKSRLVKKLNKILKK